MTASPGLPGRDAAPASRPPGAAARPLGATVVPEGVHFAVHAPHAERLSLLLLDPEHGEPLAELPFPVPDRPGGRWDLTVPGLAPGDADYLLVGPEGDLLLDPRARALAGGEEWGVRPRWRCVVTAGRPRRRRPPRPALPVEDLVVYELHVRGFTRHPSSGTAHPGTFAGLREKIGHLLRLGVNCVELLPIAEFDETDNTYREPGTGRPLANFWGYDPVAWAAPKSAYAARPERAGAVRELRDLVDALHAAGIEVILDVVFNHTAEGDHRGPTLSLRGLDEEGYYLLGPDGRPRNLTATGNTVNANHPAARALILDALRHWVREYDVDGFRFDMAGILTRGGDGTPLADPPLLREIAEDPELADRRLIAEANDATGLDLVGAFPSATASHRGRWSEWNDRYRDAVRRFLTGQDAGARELALRLAGSPDLYGARGAGASVNYVTSHDGFTLADWASYDRPHNEANGEGGTDGIAVNHSWNCGWEGPTERPDVLRRRARLVHGALTLLAVSTGVPMVTAGDEFGRTQLGNNNAYGQDNETSWVDWTLAERHVQRLEFVRCLWAFRRRHPAVRRSRAPSEERPEGWEYPPVSWHGERPGEPDWSPSSRLVVGLFHQEPPEGERDTVLVAVNADERPRLVAPPPAPSGTRWHLFVDTGDEEGPLAHEPGHEPRWSGTGPEGGEPLLRLMAHSTLVLTAVPAAQDDSPAPPGI
ncbi:glycogen debranching protein [Streptomyces marincola]|uniref:glycogen debranching protein n=1 Tax=Streptomyces marincola TaxID=2878388 RepID=UPI001CF59D87|nr:alpha-amylase family glycosyl hydrolase [Streptomyces marincola]UCM88163.1 glycogen debranching protein [Streptomyces marincola]